MEKFKHWITNNPNWLIVLATIITLLLFIALFPAIAFLICVIILGCIGIWHKENSTPKPPPLQINPNELNSLILNFVKVIELHIGSKLHFLFENHLNRIAWHYNRHGVFYRAVIPLPKKIEIDTEYLLVILEQSLRIWLQHNQAHLVISVTEQPFVKIHSITTDYYEGQRYLVLNLFISTSEEYYSHFLNNHSNATKEVSDNDIDF